MGGAGNGKNGVQAIGKVGAVNRGAPAKAGQGKKPGGKPFVEVLLDAVMKAPKRKSTTTGARFEAAAGLLLYWITNTVVSALQQWRINKLVAMDSVARKV